VHLISFMYSVLLALAEYRISDAFSIVFCFFMCQVSFLVLSQ